MTQGRWSRRSFLRSLAAAAAAAPVAGRLEAAEAAFSGTLGRLRAPGALDPALLRGRYMLGDGVTYLNHASIGTVPRAVHDAHREYLEVCETNPWLYMWGPGWDEAVTGVRGKCAALAGADPGEVAITHNTTEGFNLLAQGLALEPGDEVLFSSLNHAGASVCWEHQAERRGLRVRRFDFPVTEAPGLGPADVVAVHEEALTERTRVLVFPHVDNVVGVRHPLEPLARMAHERGVEQVLVDGAQTAGMMPLELSGSGVDAYASSPHKWIQSPKGLGLLYLRRRLQERLRPMWVTWGQESWAGTVRVFEDYGTRNLPEVLAMGDALDFQEALGAARKVERYRALRAELAERVEASPALTWNSPRSWDAGSAVLSVGVEGTAAGRVAEALRRDHGVVVRPFESHGLNALRVSPNAITTSDELERLVRGVETAVSRG